MGVLKMAKAKGTILQELKKIVRVDLLILDDCSIQPFDTQARHGKKSTLITSQIPVENWYDISGEEAIANAFLTELFIKQSG
ncbi:hypothetical protein EZS27_021310 [termite gut metagenome]|uniref:IstB-like ATP-binding domain-containing protein n=1 Tax=termite gut metagenome TaxID=433724 RepID=A0A5J4RB22_9ZZZZ